MAGVKTIRSTSLEGQSQVFAEFRLATDMTRAMQDVRDKIAQVKPGFPRDVKDPLVIRADQENQQPVASLAILSPTITLRELTSLTDQVIVKVSRTSLVSRASTSTAASPGKYWCRSSRMR